MDRFKMTDMGDVSRVLGMNVTRDREEGDHDQPERLHGGHSTTLRGAGLEPRIHPRTGT